MPAVWEIRLSYWGLGALLGAAALRYLLPLLLWRTPWLLDTQLISVLLLSAASITAGCLAAGGGGRLLSAALGAACWATALSFAPRYLWPLPAARPDWQVYAALAVLGLALLLRYYLLRRWGIGLTGQGWEGIEAWAHGRPLYARALAARRLDRLGWRRRA